MKQASLFVVTAAFWVLFGAGIATAQDDETPFDEAGARAEPGEEVLVTLRVPLGSPLFAETPVAVVNEEPITFRDLTRLIASSHMGRTEDPTSARKNYADLLKRVITTELIVQEARNIGFDETPEFERQVEKTSGDLLLSALMSRRLETVQADPAEVEDLYKRMSREFLLSTVTFKNEADALSFKERSDSGEDFDELAKRFTEEGRAEIESDDQKYAKLKDLLPRIAQAAFVMEPGDVSQIFSTDTGFLMFRVQDARFREDAGVEQAARQKVLERAKQDAAREYADELVEKYTTTDESLLKKADFEEQKSGFLSLGKAKPVDFQKLLEDERVVATVHSDPPTTITVADLARDVQKGLYHGVDQAIDRKEELNKKKRIKLRNMLFRQSAILEARNQGLDRTEEYTDAIESFESSLLFETFIKKVIVPDVKISEDEIREYYKKHTGEFSSPKMFRMNGLAFYELTDAEQALGKLQKRADFKWVSANSPGQVERGSPGVLDFKNALLSLTALPEDLQKDADRAKSGGVLLYSAPKGYHYVIAVEKVFPAAPQPYEAARGPIAKIIMDEKIRTLIDDWSAKLNDAYETKIFVTGLDE